MRYMISFLLILSSFVMISCSGAAKTPSVPETPDLPGATVNSDNSGILFSGTMEIDLESLEISTFENRHSDYVYNITGFMPDKCPGGCFRFRIVGMVGTVLEIELTIENPLAIQVYDVRIQYMDLYGKTVVNPDSYTDFLGTPIHRFFPFTAFAKDVPQRAFPTGPGGIDIETLFLDFPPGSSAAVNYAITASLPGNTEEPYEISEMMQSGSLTPSGGTATISCKVDDHQGNVQNVYLNAIPFTGTPVAFHPTSPAGYYEVDISNTAGAPVGIYNQLIMALSPNSQNISTYNFVPIEVTGETTGSYWSQFQHDKSHAGLTDVVGPQNAGLMWKYDGVGTNALHCVEGYDGTIYYGTVSNGGRIEAVNPDGTEKWVYTPSVTASYGRPIGVTPDNQILYVNICTTSFRGRMVGLDTVTGTELWLSDGDFYFSSNSYGLILDNGDCVVSGEIEGVDYTAKYDRHGNQVISIPSQWNWCTAPVQGVDGTIYIKHSSGELRGINPDTFVMEHSVSVYESGLNTQASLAIRSDGSIMFAGNVSMDVILWCFDADLNLSWKMSPGEGIPIDGFGIGLNDEIYFTVASTNTLYAVAPDGSSVLWTYPNANQWTTPAVGADGTIYCGLNNGIVALDPNGNVKWSYVGASYAASPVISHDGYVYANIYGDLHKFGDM